MTIKKTTINLFFSLSILMFFSAFAFNNQRQNNKWIAPKEASDIKNPLSTNPNVIKEGKKIFTNMCVICHGAKGKGDGVAGAALNPKPSNLTSAIVQDQTDGALFWKLTEGRPPMASYKEILSEEKRWQLVIYMRTLK